VRNAQGDERGRVVQLNEIPAGTLNGFWGEIALVVAAEAAGGINDVVNRQSGREPTPQTGGVSAPVEAPPAAGSPKAGPPGASAPQAGPPRKS
jgi:hypothetical protein